MKENIVKIPKKFECEFLGENFEENYNLYVHLMNKVLSEYDLDIENDDFREKVRIIINSLLNLIHEYEN